MTTAAPETAPQEQIADAAAEVFARLAAPGVAAPWESLADFAPALGAHIQHGLGTLMSRPALDLRTRELTTISMLAALGNAEPQLAFHTAGAIRAGATVAEVLEALMQVALYAGVPRTLNALAVARRALVEAGALPG